MSDLAIAHQMVFSVAPCERQAQPRPRDKRLMSRALAISCILHLLLLSGGLLAYWFAQPAAVVGPRAVDVTLVELSAFDTVLSPPQLPQQEPKARAVIAPPVEHRVQVRQPKREEKRIEVKDPPRLKTAPKPHADTAEAAAPSTTTSAASLGGGNDVTQKARISYHHMVATLLAKAKRYPERAVRGHVTGSGSVRLTISAAGSVKSLEVATSTQSTILDDELLRMVERAAPFPSFPSDMTQSDVTLLVPVSFRLES